MFPIAQIYLESCSEAQKLFRKKYDTEIEDQSRQDLKSERQTLRKYISSS